VTRAAPAASGAALSVLVAVAASAGTIPLVAALILAVVAVASGWATLLNLPTPRGSTAVVALAGAVAIGIAAMTGEPPYLRWLPSVLALGVVAEFVHQLFRRDMRPRLVESVTGVVSGVVVVSLGAGWMAALHSMDGAGLVVGGAAAALGATAATGLPWPQRITGPSAVVAAAAFGALAGRLLPEHHAIPMAILGVGIGVVVAGLDRLLAHLPTAGYLQSAVAMGTAPVTASGLVVYTLGRLVS
jgi:hypothetical protein